MLWNSVGAFWPPTYAHFQALFVVPSLPKSPLFPPLHFTTYITKRCTRRSWHGLFSLTPLPPFSAPGLVTRARGSVNPFSGCTSSCATQMINAVLVLASVAAAVVTVAKIGRPRGHNGGVPRVVYYKGKRVDHDVPWPQSWTDEM